MKAGHLRSRLRIHQPIESVGRLSSTKTTWPVRETIWGGFLEARRRLRTYGVGELPAGSAAIEVRRSAKVQERDGVEVLSGPERGTRWRVTAVDRTEVDRQLLTVEPYSGTFE